MSTLTHSAKAFGDGSHPTTRLLLETLAVLEGFVPSNVLDVGCGSGILSLYTAQRWECRVTACDIEAESVATTSANAATAGLEHRLTCVQACGFDHPSIAVNMPYDLIVMNILAEPLVALAHAAYAHAAPEGLLMLSGILRHQKDAISEVYQSIGFELRHSLTLGDWVALIWVKP